MVFNDPSSPEPQLDYLEKERMAMIRQFINHLPADERMRLCMILGSESGRSRLFTEVSHYAKVDSLEPMQPARFPFNRQHFVRQVAIIALAIIAGLFTGRILTELLDSRSCQEPSAPSFSAPPIEPPLPRVRE